MMPIRRVRRLALCAVLLLTLLAALPAAVASDSPVSLARSDRLPLAAVDEHDLPPVNVEALLAEDALAADRFDAPYRVGYPMATDLSPANSGTWEDLPGGGQVWRLVVRSEGALWLALGFGTYRLQEGATLWVHDGTSRNVLGPYGAADVRDHGQLWLPPIPGDRAVLELRWPESLRGLAPNIHLGTVSHGYKAWAAIAEDVPGGLPEGNPSLLASGSCNVDVQCPLGDDWQDQKRGVARLLINGSGLCSGSLINTTAGDCRPYLLTARHCISSASAAAGTVFRFNYERPLCGSGIVTTNETVSGSTIVASYAASDFTLLQLSSAPPASYDTYFNGWTRTSQPGQNSTGIHHPSGDYKKISYNDDPLVDGQNWGPDHWRVTEWEIGTTEGGSSGSPLFDQDHRIVGQLHGGTASCTSLTYDEYGKLVVSWTGGGAAASRLSDWLDPLGTGDVAIDGVDHDFCLHPRPVLEYGSHVAVEELGNGDGVLDPGESFRLSVDVRNTGSLPALGVAGTLSAESAGSAVASAGAAWPDIPTTGEKVSDGPGFLVQLDPSYTCGEPVSLRLDLSASGDEGPWVLYFQVPTGIPLVNEQFRDDMESGAGGWTVVPLLGSETWYLTTADSRSPEHAWTIDSTIGRRDTALVMAPIADLPSGAALAFDQRYDTEANRDGGVLEYSVDDGASWVDAGPLIVEGAYDSSVGSSESSPLAGRPVWSGDSGGWISTRIDLGSLAGENVLLRWRFATNFFVADGGWFVDDVRIESTSFTCNATSEVPGEAGPTVPGGSALVLDRHPDGYLLRWSMPESGGAATDFVLYGTALQAPVSTPQCELDLGAASPAVVGDLPSGRGFLVVGRNSLGEGSYGTDSSGVERAQAADVCP